MKSREMAEKLCQFCLRPVNSGTDESLRGFFEYRDLRSSWSHFRCVDICSEASRRARGQREYVSLDMENIQLRARLEHTDKPEWPESAVNRTRDLERQLAKALEALVVGIRVMTAICDSFPDGEPKHPAIGECLEAYTTMSAALRDPLYAE